MKIGHIIGLSVGIVLLAVNVNAGTLYDAQFSQRIELAKKGDKRAQYKLGIAYLRGSETKVDIPESIKWFTKAANQGYVKAMNKLGKIYYLKKAGDKKQKKAVKWFIKAAKNKHPESAYYLSKIYLEGKLLKRDLERAAHWDGKAKEYGYDDGGRLAKEIKVAEKQTSHSMAHAPVTKKNRPVKKPTAPVAARKKTSAPKAKVDKFSLSQQKELVYKTSWYLKGQPAEYMPSKLNRCRPNGKVIKCKSNTFVKNRDDYNAHVEVESIIKNFTPAGSFVVDYRFNYLQVSPQSGVDSEADLPKVGWQKTMSKLRCRIVDKTMVKCFTDDLRVERYYNK